MWVVYLSVLSFFTLTSATQNLDILNLYRTTFTGDSSLVISKYMWGCHGKTSKYLYPEYWRFATKNGTYIHYSVNNNQRHKRFATKNGIYIHYSGTYYWFTEEGTCSYPPPQLPPVAKDPRITDLVALNRPQFFGSLACGMCFSVNGSGVGLGNDPITGQHIVFVKDMCPECKKGDVDFSQTADGRWNISIRAIQCPVGNTSIEYKFQGSNRYYLKLQVRNARIPATSADLKSPNMSWRQMSHTMDGFWTISINTGVTYPIYLRLTAANGEVIEDKLDIYHIVNEKVFHGNGVQFRLDSKLPM